MGIRTTVQIRNKGNLTLPVELRRKYDLNEGDIYTVIDLGEGALMLIPRMTSVDRLGDRVAETMAENGVSLDEILAALDEERERYYRERYVQSESVPG